MGQEVEAVLQMLLGLSEDELHIGHMVVRVVVVYIAALLIVRLGEKRFIAKNTAFDVLLGIMVGSIISRAITGNAPFFPTLAAAAALVFVHWLFSVGSFRFPRFGDAIKGRPRLLVENGSVKPEAMRRSHISQQD